MPLRRPQIFAGTTGLFGLLAAISLWLLPRPHQPLHYLIAGTLATAVSLAALFLLTCVVRSKARSPRKN